MILLLPIGFALGFAAAFVIILCRAGAVEPTITYEELVVLAESIGMEFPRRPPLPDPLESVWALPAREPRRTVG